jgi:ABC-2 type transport system permease protein
MNKIWLIFQREFLNRVQKKSFLIATILIPLIFPAMMAIMLYIFIKQEEGYVRTRIEVLDESEKMRLENTDRYEFVYVQGPLAVAKEKYNLGKYPADSLKPFALLHIPEFELANPQGITLYTKENASIRITDELQDLLKDKIHDLKLEKFAIDKQTLKSLTTSVDLNSVNLGQGVEKKRNQKVLAGLGFALGVLIYIFILVYGMQIMLGVIEEKSSKIVEVIISSVRPFQLMLGKILGIAAVGLVQFTIWAIIITSVSFVTLRMFNAKMPQQQAMEQISKMNNRSAEAQPFEENPAVSLMKSIDEIPVGLIVFNFAFYFLGGYLLYGALFAAVGAAVDSQQEAQQFNLPLMLPLIIGYLSLFLFIIPDSDSSASFWFSIIPFTSPVAMVGRLGFGVPLWQLILSQVLLIGGFIFTTWVAARIYRVGILMHGSKINYKILAKWFMMKG